MNGTKQPDLLPHKYRPNSIEKVAKCHLEQAKLLKQWILDFINKPGGYESDSEESEISRESWLTNGSKKPQIEKKCALLTGPPGVGKTSLVYTIANELKLHVVESHPSEKRDFKLFSTLKLANQKGKINPIAKLFQNAKQKQSDNRQDARRKRRKLAEFTSSNVDSSKPNNHSLSLSGDSSVVLFDDIDVVFEEDGPFLKSLVDFIHESKRPVILTATQSIDSIKAIIVHLEHIHLGRPPVDDCTRLLEEVCRNENYDQIRTLKKCKLLAERLNCDIRQCLNSIHFYGEELSDLHKCIDLKDSPHEISPEFSRLRLIIRKDEFKKSSDPIDDEETILYFNKETISPEVKDEPSDDGRSQLIDRQELTRRNKPLLDCYDYSSWIDIMNASLNDLSREQSLTNWLNRTPPPPNEIYDSNSDLSERIRNSIIETAQKLHPDEFMDELSLDNFTKSTQNTRQRSSLMTGCMNLKIKGRIEPPDKEFYTEVAPMLGEMIHLEASRRLASNQTSSRKIPIDQHLSPFASSRRSRRIPSYLESISIYLDPEEYLLISGTLLGAETLDR